MRRSCILRFNRLSLALLTISITAAIPTRGVAADEVLRFKAPHYAGVREFLRGDPAPQVEVRADLTVPDGAVAPMPLIVLAHASNGVTADVPFLAGHLNKAGYATIYYDSYAARGLGSMRQGGAITGAANQVADAFAVLGTLKDDARFDLRRSAMIGMSAGGGAALAAATRYLRARTLGPEGPDFAAHVAFYPGLHMAPAANELSGRPILILQGAADDYMAPDRPRAWVDYVARLAPGTPVRMVMLPGGPHSFLSPGGRHIHAADYVNASRCPIVLISRTERRRLAVDGSFAGDEPCKTTQGGSLGPDANATRLALVELDKFLAEAFR